MCCATDFGCAAYQRDAGVQCSAAAGQTLLGDHISCAIGLIVQSALHRSCSPVEVERLRRPLQALGLSRASAAAAATVCATANRGRPSWGMIYLIVGRASRWLLCPPADFGLRKPPRRCRDMLLQPERPPATSHAAQSACGEGPVEAAAHAGAMQARFSPYDYNGGCAASCLRLPSALSPACCPASEASSRGGGHPLSAGRAPCTKLHLIRHREPPSISRQPPPAPMTLHTRPPRTTPHTTSRTPPVLRTLHGSRWLES